MKETEKDSSKHFVRQYIQEAAAVLQVLAVVVSVFWLFVGLVSMTRGGATGDVILGLSLVTLAMLGLIPNKVCTERRRLAIVVVGVLCGYCLWFAIGKIMANEAIPIPWAVTPLIRPLAVAFSLRSS